MVRNVGVKRKAPFLYLHHGNFEVMVDRGYFYEDINQVTALSCGGQRRVGPATDTDRAIYPTSDQYVAELNPKEQDGLVKIFEILEDTEPVQITFKGFGFEQILIGVSKVPLNVQGPTPLQSPAALASVPSVPPTLELATATETPIPIPTATLSPSPTPTPTPTSAPSPTLTPSPSVTPTATLTRSPSPTATATPASSPTPLPTPTFTPSPSATPSATALPTSTPPPPSPTITPSGRPDVQIACIFFDGVVPRSESDEYVEIVNLGDAPQQLDGWVW